MVRHILLLFALAATLLASGCHHHRWAYRHGYGCGCEPACACPCECASPCSLGQPVMVPHGP